MMPRQLDTFPAGGAPLVVLLGPTASGKSGLAIDLALELGGEIISADSRQVYRGMDIGTAKVAPDERRGVPHHLIDVADPDEQFGLADFLSMTAASLSAIRARGKLPILVGGSGQYVWAVAEEWSVPRVQPNPALRERLLERARVDGPARLYSALECLDPVAAQAIHPNNVRRVVRALEIAGSTGRAPSSQRSRREVAPSVLLLGIALPRAELYSRIDRRVGAMFEDGFAREVEGLLSRGYERSLPAMSGIGYTQVVQFLHGEITLPEAMAGTALATHRFARQQAAWFRADDQRIHWLDARDCFAAASLVQEWLSTVSRRQRGEGVA